MNSLIDLRLPLPTGELETSLVPVQGHWAVMLRRRRTRPALLELDDAQLRDIGLTREEASREGHKPFWKG
ncbi:MAG: hypothetical protein K0S77_973 [Pseudomonas sp.]|jgi:uncharacterized protein YjiS (DUF1127 family)|nr:hypothetical protein [Pseudomonas sp.]